MNGAIRVSSRAMELPRVQGFEFNDSERAPGFVRETIVESLSRTLRWGRMLSELVRPFRRFLAASGASEVLDLCAGAAGPATILASEMRRAGDTPPRFLLTDDPRPQGGVLRVPTAPGFGYDLNAAAFVPGAPGVATIWG